MMRDDTRPESIAADIHAEIKDQISSGALPGGARVTEEQLARRFGTSRTPVREALRRLVADGFVVFKPNSGSFVRTWSAAEIDGIFHVRAVLESEVAALAAAHVTPDQISSLRALQADMEAITARPAPLDFSELSARNRDFHRIIAEASRNDRLVQMLANTIELPIVQGTYRRYTPAQLARSHHHHRELCDALDSRDADWARAVMQCHIWSARAAMIRQSVPRGMAGAPRG
jgi:DNA-binding GntR family transcriptional regulator